MWSQCLCLCGIVPSGGKALTVCWHINTPIINSRNALSFRFHSLYSFCTLHRALPCSPVFSVSHAQHFPHSNVPISTVIPPLSTYGAILNDCSSQQKNYFSLVWIWSENVCLNGNPLDIGDDQTEGSDDSTHLRLRLRPLQATREPDYCV